MIDDEVVLRNQYQIVKFFRLADEDDDGEVNLTEFLHGAHIFESEHARENLY